MPLKKKIQSLSLLLLYLIVVGHHCVASGHHFLGELPRSTHQHEGHAEAHHEHHFHIGILHFLKHLLEHTELCDKQSDKHLSNIPAIKNIKATYADIQFIQVSSALLDWVFTTESYHDPPYYAAFLQQVLLSNSPHRGPPTLC